MPDDYMKQFEGMTPLPWWAHHNVVYCTKISSGRTFSIAECDQDTELPHSEQEANARYIVHAANEYPKLVELLKNARLVLPDNHYLCDEIDAALSPNGDQPSASTKEPG